MTTDTFKICNPDSIPCVTEPTLWLQLSIGSCHRTFAHAVYAQGSLYAFCVLVSRGLHSLGIWLGSESLSPVFMLSSAFLAWLLEQLFSTGEALPPKEHLAMSERRFVYNGCRGFGIQ